MPGCSSGVVTNLQHVCPVQAVFAQAEADPRRTSGLISTSWVMSLFTTERPPTRISHGLSRICGCRMEGILEATNRPQQLLCSDRWLPRQVTGQGPTLRASVSTVRGKVALNMTVCLSGRTLLMMRMICSSTTCASLGGGPWGSYHVTQQGHTED